MKDADIQTHTGFSIRNLERLRLRCCEVGEFTDEVKAYLARKNEESKSINWQFTNEKARIKLKSLYPTI